VEMRLSGIGRWYGTERSSPIPGVLLRGSIAWPACATRPAAAVDPVSAANINAAASRNFRNVRKAAAQVRIGPARRNNFCLSYGPETHTMQPNNTTGMAERAEPPGFSHWGVGVCMCAPDELRILELARQRNPKALAQLVALYQKPVLGFISRWVDRQDAEDVAQEVWMKVHQEIHRSPDSGGYDPAKGSFYSWVVSYVAKPKAQDWRRAKVRGKKVSSLTESEDGTPAVEPEASAETWRPDRLVEIEEDFRSKVMAYTELFRLTFLCGGYPHEQMAFGFAKLLHGSRSARAMEGVPEKVDRLHGAKELTSLTDVFWQEYRSGSGIKDRMILRDLKKSLEPTQSRLQQDVDELIRPLPGHLSDLRGKTTGQTCLQDYYAENPEGRKGPGTHPITHWCYRLRQRLMHIMGISADGDLGQQMTEEMARRATEGPIQPRGCNRCKLRHMPPCRSAGGRNSRAPQ